MQAIFRLFYTNVGKFYLINSIASSHTSKAEEAKVFKKKLQKEKQQMTEKIKMHEKEKIERYSKMFKLNNQESKIFLKILNSSIQ